MKRYLFLLPVFLALQAGVPPALAWTWPVDGPVLRPFNFDREHAYDGGQHRGIDIGAPSGTAVRAPAAGAITFAGTVPVGGRTVTIATDDGYAVTLVHLGATTVAKGAAVGEGEVVGAIGPSGEPEGPEPYVHLGIRLTADQEGYLDPLAFLPASVGAGEAPPETAPAPIPVPPPAPTPEPSTPAAAAPAGDGDSTTTAAPPANAAPVRRGTARFAPARELTPVREPAKRLASAAGRERRQERPALPPRTRRASFERPVVAAAARPAAASAPEAAGLTWIQLAAPAALGPLLAGIWLARRRQLGGARLADGAPAVVEEPIGGAAEDAAGLRLREEDRLLFDRDLELVLLAETEALADLDRDDDATEFVDVADDPRPRRSPHRSPRCSAHRRPRLARGHPSDPAPLSLP
jgi:hypothetical protein